MSFILDALRKSEHERKRSTVPGLAQVPLATPPPELPRWALVVMAVLAAALLTLGGAWWQSRRDGAQLAAVPPTLERTVASPPAALEPMPTQLAPPRTQLVPSPGPREPAPAAPASSSLASEAAVGSSRISPAAATEQSQVTVVELGNRPVDVPIVAAPQLNLPTDAPALPSAAALAAEGIALPPLRLELHAFNAEPRNRFVFINGRKYVEGERLIEGPQLLAIEPTGAVLLQSGRRFLLRQE